MPELHRYVPKLSETDIERVWAATKKWKTADSEVTILRDFTNALLKSGYYPNSHEFQGGGVYYDDSLTIFEKSGVEQAFDCLCNTPSRFDSKQYRDGKLGFHPSSILSSQDIMRNPELMVLLVGELSPQSYFSGEIKTDSQNKEIVVERYGYYVDDNETGLNRFKKRDMNKTEALDSAVNIASGVSLLSSPEKRLEISEVGHNSPFDAFERNEPVFKFERNIGGKLGLEFKDPYITVDGEPLYEAGVINQNMIKKREAQKRLDFIHNSRAVQQIGEAIKVYERDLASEQGAYFPIFILRN